ncbi:hypothetical protein COOONC_06979 [Cooperia oncophora]
MDLALNVYDPLADPGKDPKNSSSTINVQPMLAKLDHIRLTINLLRPSNEARRLKPKRSSERFWKALELFQVTSPNNWLKSTRTNINFLADILCRASQYGLTVGIYTNFYDWSQITDGATIDNAMLW